MKILLVVPFLPYPGAGHAGGKYGYHLLCTLAKRHHVHLVTRFFPGEETQLSRLRSMVAGLDVVEGPGAYSKSSPRMLARVVASHWRLARLTQAVLEREHFDVCQVEFTESGLFWRTPRNTCAVITLHDVMAKPAHRRYLAARGLGRIVAWGKWQVTRAVEAFGISKFQRVFALSDEDLRWANELYPKAKVQVLRYPSGIEFIGLPRREDPRRVLFVGALNRPSNQEAIQWFLDGCWSDVKRDIPNAQFQIVGHGLPEIHRVRWSADPTINIVGSVDSVERYYKEAAVFVAPILTGGGVIVKILDGLGAGVPVVTTTRGNEGIGAEDGKSVLIANTYSDFSLAVVRLLKSRTQREAIGEAGMRYVGRVFSNNAFIIKLDETYARLILETQRSC